MSKTRIPGGATGGATGGGICRRYRRRNGNLTARRQTTQPLPQCFGYGPIHRALPLMGREHGLEQIASFQEGIDHVRTQFEFLLADAVQQVFEDMGGF